MAMKPEERPMSLTRPMPLSAEDASTLAAISACCASSTAVSNPKHRSTCSSTLSLQTHTHLGISHTLRLTERLAGDGIRPNLQQALQRTGAANNKNKNQVMYCVLPIRVPCCIGSGCHAGESVTAARL
jgi:hypothetical protein